MLGYLVDDSAKLGPLGNQLLTLTPGKPFAEGALAGVQLDADFFIFQKRFRYVGGPAPMVIQTRRQGLAQARMNLLPYILNMSAGFVDMFMGFFNCF